MNLLDELDRHGGFTHAFLTTYTFQPAFFEDRVLSCKALSGCPNIVVFVDRGTYEEVCSGSSGGSLINRRYMLAPINPVSTGVFHPKLWLFAGEKRSRLLVGSANLTRAGITTNMEMVSVFDYEAKSKESGPLLAEAFSFVESLCERRCPRTPTLDKLLAGARVYASLGGKPGEDRQVNLVHNLDEALIEVLPGSFSAKGVSATVYGPFYDAKIGAILDSLLRRGALSQIEIIVQQDTNTLDARALQRWARRNKSVKLLVSTVDIPGRPLHAKGLVLCGDKGKPMLAVLGSANFTEAALLRSAAKGGNVEVGLRLMGDAAGVVLQALAKPPFDERRAVDLTEVRSRPEAPTSTSPSQNSFADLLSAEIAPDFTRIDIDLGETTLPPQHQAKVELCVQRCDSAYMDFASAPGQWHTDGRASFRLLPRNAQRLNRAARAWLSMKADGGEVLASNVVWLLHLDEVTESEKKQESRILRQFRESGKGLTSYLQSLIDQGAIDRSVDLLENLSIKYSNDLWRARGPFLRPRHAKSPLRDDEVPPSVWRLTMNQRRRLGEAVRDFVERHHGRVLERHIRNPNPNGIDNFLDVLETCTDLSMKSGSEDLLEWDTVQAMVRGGLGLFSGNVLSEGYAKALRGHMYGHEDELRKAEQEAGAAERVSAVLLAVVSNLLRGDRNTPDALTLGELVDLSGLDRLGAFFSFVGEPSADLPNRVAARIAEYSEPRFFTVQLAGDDARESSVGALSGPAYD